MLPFQAEKVLDILKTRTNETGFSLAHWDVSMHNISASLATELKVAIRKAALIFIDTEIPKAVFRHLFDE